MIRTTGLKTEYAPIKQIGDEVYLVGWDYTEITEKVYQKDELGNYVLDEQGNPIPTKEELPTDLATWMQEIFYYKPSGEFLQNMILDWYNKQIDDKILRGFKWNGYDVWLSQENQFNYKAAYDLAVLTNGLSLPVTFKFGTAEAAVYKQFNTLKELADFYRKAASYVNNTLEQGWKTKDSINWDSYKL